MNNRDKQKDRERKVFEQFLALQRLFPEDVSPIYSDEPDVIIGLPNKKLGIELRELNISEALRELESIKENIVLDGVRTACIERGRGDVCATVLFSPAYAGLPNPAYRVATWSAKRKREIIDGLASQIERKAAFLLWGSCVFRPGPEIPEISEVFISRVLISKLKSTTTPKHWWKVTNAGYVKYHVIEPIQEALDEKGKKLDRYLEKCDECWLLLYADRGHKAKRLLFREEDRGHRFKSKFSRAFFMERFHEDFHELHLTA